MDIDRIIKFFLYLPRKVYDAWIWFLTELKGVKFFKNEDNILGKVLVISAIIGFVALFFKLFLSILVVLAIIIAILAIIGFFNNKKNGGSSSIGKYDIN